MPGCRRPGCAGRTGAPALWSRISMRFFNLYRYLVADVRVREAICMLRLRGRLDERSARGLAGSLSVIGVIGGDAPEHDRALCPNTLTSGWGRVSGDPGPALFGGGLALGRQAFRPPTSSAPSRQSSFQASVARPAALVPGLPGMSGSRCATTGGRQRLTPLLQDAGDVGILAAFTCADLDQLERHVFPGKRRRYSSKPCSTQAGILGAHCNQLDLHLALRLALFARARLLCIHLGTAPGFSSW